MDQRHRKQLADLAWHGLQVFVASLLVTTAAGDYLTRLRTLEFWQEVAGSAAVAVLSQLLAYAALRMCPGQGSGKNPDAPP
jgi:hypothetical protein